MGAWSEGLFDNDSAVDLVVALVNGHLPADHVGMFVHEVARKGDGYLEAPDGETALAAAEIIAYLEGRPSASATQLPDLANWVANADVAVTPELVADAKAAVARVLGEDSELQQLWCAEGNAALCDAWMDAVADLSDRL